MYSSASFSHLGPYIIYFFIFNDFYQTRVASGLAGRANVGRCFVV